MVYHDISQEQLLLLITQAVQAELQKRSRQEYRAAQAMLARAINRLRVKKHEGLMGK